MRKILIHFFLFFYGVITLQAQENAGILHSNYSPTSTVFINPSTLADSKAFLDIHIIGASLFANTSMVYLPGNKFKLTRSFSSNNSEGFPNPLFNPNGKLKHGYVDLALQGPSAAIVLGRNSFGVFTNARLALDMRNIPDHLANYIINGFGYVPQHGFEYSGKNIKLNSMAWGELGFTYARMLKVSNNHIFNGGITVKRLFGISIASFLLDELKYNVIDTSDIEFINVSGSYGYALPEFGAGKGWGFDVGFTYKKMLENVDGYVPHSPNNGCQEADYQYKLGISIIDFGQIKFASNTQQRSLQDASAYWQNYSKPTANGAIGIDSTLNSEFGGVNAGVVSKNSLVSKLPAAVSIQFDYKLHKNFYAGIFYIKGLPHQNFGVQRSDILAVTPRFEVKRLEISMPVTMYQYQDYYAGLAFRFNNIIIGTDRIGPYIFRPDINGIDFYLAIKYTIFKRMACAEKKQRNPKTRNGYKQKMIPCSVLK